MVRIRPEVADLQRRAGVHYIQYELNVDQAHKRRVGVILAESEQSSPAARFL